MSTDTKFIYKNLKKFSLQTSLFLIFTILLLISSVVLATMRTTVYTKAAKEFSQNEEKEKITDLKKDINNLIKKYQGDITLFANLSMVQNYNRELFNYQINATRENFEKLDIIETSITNAFAVYCKTNRNILKIRYINNLGDELIRVDNILNDIVITEKQLLQNKKDRDYFTETSLLQKNEMYLSHLDLNEEYGMIEKPFRPVLRIAMPVFNDLNERSGIIVISISAKAFYALIEDYFVNEEVYLVDNDGYFLYAKEEIKLYGKDLGTDEKFSKYFPDKDFLYNDKFPDFLEEKNTLYISECIENQTFKNNYFWNIITINNNNYFWKMNRLIYLMGFFVIGVIFLQFIVLRIIWIKINLRLSRLVDALIELSKGEIPEKIVTEGNNELTQMENAVNLMTENRERTIDFIKKVSSGNFNSTDELNNGLLSKALNEMRTELLSTKQQEQQRIEAEKKIAWVTEGLNKISDVLRHHSENLEEMAFQALLTTIKYLDANQGGFFAVNDENKEDIFLELIVSFAYDNRKAQKKKILPMEGLLGTCFVEKRTKHLSEIPEDYIIITSGLGEALPRNLLIVPLLSDNDILGMMEIASFRAFDEYQINYVERACENIASTLSIAKINRKMKILLEQADKQTKKIEDEKNIVMNKLFEEENHRKKLELTIEDLQNQLKSAYRHIKNLEKKL